MADVAAKLGVSRIAVSMALRGHHRISIERRREIKRMAREMGFVPDPLLSALAAHRRQRVPAKEHGVLAWINHWKEPKQLRQFREFDLYWRGASEAAFKFGYRVDEIRWGWDCPPKRLEKILLARGIEGVLIPPHDSLLDWEGFDWSKFSVVRFGLSVPSPDSNVVTSDTYRATVMAINKLHEYGYQRIGVTVNEEYNRRIGGNFLSGFYYSQASLNLKPAIPPLLTLLKSRTAAEILHQKAALQQWLRQYQPEVVLTSDMEIPGLIRDLGYRVPQDLALAGTTVLDIPGVDAGIDQHAEAIGRTAVETLLKQMNVNERGEPAYPCRILVESRWKDGYSLPPAALRTTPWVPPPSVVQTAGGTELGARRVTLQDIANTVGVSKNTISIALRNNPRIRPELRERIRRVAAEMGYIADPILQRLAAYRRRGGSMSFRSVIAWVNHWREPDKLRSYHEFEQYWRGAVLAAKRLGYRLDEFPWPADLPAKQAEETLLERGVLGLLLPPHKPDVDWGDFDWSRFSLIRFGLSVRRVDANLVAADHLRAMMMAVRRIHESGYGRIGLVYDAAHDHSMGGNYFGGFLWANNLLAIKNAIPALDFDQQAAAPARLKALKKWMLDYRPTAVLTASPQVPALLRELGYATPRDVAVAGTSLYDLPLDAGIDQCPHAIGQIAAEMLIKQITLNERGEPPDPCRILIESRWQNGQSLPCRKQASLHGRFA
jgi:DNA-binding LacI/PurR family transcriptional regulator